MYVVVGQYVVEYCFVGQDLYWIDVEVYWLGVVECYYVQGIVGFDVFDDYGDFVEVCEQLYCGLLCLFVWQVWWVDVCDQVVGGIVVDFVVIVFEFLLVDGFDFVFLVIGVMCQQEFFE